MNSMSGYLSPQVAQVNSYEPVMLCYFTNELCGEIVLELYQSLLLPLTFFSISIFWPKISLDFSQIKV